MSSLRVKHQVTPKARLHLSEGKRTVKARKKMSDKMSGKLRKILQNMSLNPLKTDEYTDIMNSVIGSDNINLLIKQVKKEGASATFKPNFSVLKEIEAGNLRFDYEGFTLSCNLDGDNIVSHKETIMHESRHVFDHICNPKYTILRQAEFLDNQSKLQACNKIVNFTVGAYEYSPKRILDFIKIPSYEKELKAMLTDFDPCETVSILQLCRHYLETEKNAYKENAKYFIGATKEKTSLGAILKFMHRLKKSFEFGEKKRVLKKMIKEYAKKDKAKLASVLLDKNRS